MNKDLYSHIHHFVKGCMYAWNWNLKKDLVPLPADFIRVDELGVESTLPSALGVLFDKDHIQVFKNLQNSCFRKTNAIENINNFTNSTSFVDA